MLNNLIGKKQSRCLNCWFRSECKNVKKCILRCVYFEKCTFEFLESHYITPRKYLKQLENIRLCGCGKGVIDLAQKSVISLNNQLVEWLRVSLMHSCYTSRACLTKRYMPTRSSIQRLKTFRRQFRVYSTQFYPWYQIIQHARGWLIRVAIEVLQAVTGISYIQKKREIVIKIHYVPHRMTRNDCYDGRVTTRVVNEIIPKQDV